MRNVLSTWRVSCPTLRGSAGPVIRRSKATKWNDSRLELPELRAENIRQDKHQSYWIREHGKTDLPLPPFLDPVVFASKMEYSRLHQQEWIADSPAEGFRAELAANPYAAILATPMRACAHTAVRQPRALLQQVSVVKTPHGTKKFKIEPHAVAERHSDMRLTTSSTYLLNKPVVIDDLKKSHSRTVNENQALKIAQALDKNPNSLRVGDVVSWDPDMRQQLENLLLQDIYCALEMLQQEYAHLLLTKEEAQARIEQVIAFVRFAQASEPPGRLHGKELFTISVSEDSQTAVGTIKAITVHKDTIPLMTALERYRIWQEGWTQQEYRA